MISLVLVFLAGAAIAFVNGANDVSKGIATLVGSGVTNFRRAIAWGTIWTGLGGLAAALVAKAMVQTFGKGLLASGVYPTLAMAIAVISGAALWVGIATLRGLPVSTTHAIVGSVVGIAVIGFGPAGINWSALMWKIALPLLLSPAVALILTAVAVRITKALAPQSDCLCVEAAQPLLSANYPIPTAIPVVHLSTCTAAEHISVPGITFDHLHWLTSAGTSFSRGLNDTPKMVALIIGGMLVADSWTLSPFLMFAVITAGILAGSWFAGRKVTGVLACKVIRMDHREGFLANLITAALVGPGAAFGLPMSTTHVASGALLGLNSRERKANLAVVRDMVFAWLVTLPVAALLAILSLFFLHTAGIK